MRATIIVVGALIGVVLIAGRNNVGADTCSDACDKADASCSKSCKASDTNCFTKCINEKESCLAQCK
jgi:peptidoglycan hydrolase CwlO-like protein